MKPTFQISRPSRHSEPPRPASHISKSPATDWSFQSAVELHGAAVVSAPTTNAVSPVRGLHGLTQGLFDAETKWENRIEATGLIIVSFLAAWPVWKAAETAMSTAGYWW